MSVLGRILPTVVRTNRTCLGMRNTFQKKEKNNKGINNE